VPLLFLGGFVISQTQEEPKGFICPNVSCRKIFTSPIKTVNIGISTESYDACPYCLTKITKDNTVALNASKVSASKAEVQKQAPNTNNPPECHNHFGYLSERTAKEQIPDECLTCKEIVQCMRKRAKGQVSES